MPDLTLLRAALPSVPVVNQLPGVRKTGGDVTALREVRSAAVTDRQVRAYAALCGFADSPTAPVTFPHLLAFPLHMAVLSSPRFPFPAIGTVHVANSITQHRPVAVGETLRIEVRAAALRATSKGQEVDFAALAAVGEETVWESTSTYLRRGRTDVAGTTEERSPQRPERVVPGRVSWRVPADTGRRYAAVSGDHNPIHLYPLTARMFGFRRQIVHGMWSLARCVAELERGLPGAVTVEAAFKRPLYLPGTVAFGQDPTADGVAFALTSASSGAPHVVGSATPLPGPTGG
jgi:acyl dehydratase